jgi:CubicO group peptidase (beta-lactamase class C family)
MPLCAQIDTARVDAIFARFSGRNPGCALNLIANGQSVYEKGYGYASLELDVPITPQTVFDLGSVSKQFTAMSILLLAQDNKLTLDDDIRKYVPELPDLGPISLRQLMHHTSGWRDYTDLMALAGWDERDHTTDQDAIDILKRQRALNFPPGSTFRYSNTGYFLMSLVVKRVTGKSLRQFAAERIFGPLGMSDTQFLDDTRQIVPGRATAYTRGFAGWWQVEMSNWDQVGDGAVQTTVEDLARWDANFYTPTVGGPRIVEVMATPGLGHYGFGLWRDEYRHEPVVWHTGAWAGYRAVLMRFPARHQSIIALCNASDAHTYQLATRLANLLIPDTSAVTTYPPVRVQGATGLYSSDGEGDILDVTQYGDSVVIENAESRHALVPFANGRLRDTTDGSTYAFEKDRVIVESSGDVPDTMRRVIPEDDTQRTGYDGIYRSDELGQTWTVRVLVIPGTARGFEGQARVHGLEIHRPRGEDLVLRPLYRDGFLTLDGTPVHFLRDASGQITALSITTSGVHDLRFSRDRHVTLRTP